MRRSIGIAGYLLLVSVLPAAAQDAPPAKPPEDLSKLSLEQLVELDIDSVYAASSYAQKITEAPSSITIITRDEIDRFGYRTLADILRSVRGFYVTNDRNYSYLGVRGFNRPGDYNARVLLLVDGHRLNDNVFGSALIGTEFPLDVDLIERVEIIRGPSSSLYGTSAFFAVINVITKRADRLRGVDVSGTVGSFGTRQGRVTYGQTFASGAQMLLSGSAYDSDGQRAAVLRGVRHSGHQPRHRLERRRRRLHAASRQGERRAVHRAGALRLAQEDRADGLVRHRVQRPAVEAPSRRRATLDVQYDRTLGSEWPAGARLYYDRYAYDGDVRLRRR